MTKELEPDPLAALVPVWHPLLPSPDLAGVRAILEGAGPEAFARGLEARAQAIALSDWDENMPLKTDPYRHGLELPHWMDADMVLNWNGACRTAPGLMTLRERWLDTPYVQRLPEALRAAVGTLPVDLLAVIVNFLILLGGNRSGKSEYCAKRVVRSAMNNPGCLIVCVAGEDLEQCIKNVQRPIWKYLPVEIKQLKGKRDPRGIFHINYDRKGGFTLDKLILPNGSELLFYGARHKEAAELEGKMLGHATKRCIGFWADESVNLPWMEKLMTRANYYNALGLWSFTPVDGMTPAIKELVGLARTLTSLPAEFLSQERRHVEDCPTGSMPYLQLARKPQTAVLYFHTQLSPFGSGEGETFRTFYDSLKIQHAESGDAIKARYAYGYTEETSGRKFPKFTSANVIPRRLVPEVGTIRRWVDPHGNRPYAHWWTLTAPGWPATHYVIREWPDEQEFGPWAVPAEKTDTTSNRWKDGDRGPAQRPLGLGVTEYKLMWRDKERVPVPQAVRRWMSRPTLERRERGALDAMLRAEVDTPWHRPALREVILGGGSLDDVFERVADCFMDPRFCNAEYADDEGTTCCRFKFEEEHKDPATGVLLPDCTIRDAAGKDLEHGYGLITDLLSWNNKHPDGLVPGINAPRLYVVEECLQTRWAFSNFTGLAKGEGACKEWMDCARWLAEADLGHEEDEGMTVKSAREIVGMNER